jgi:hypothetical protein
MGSGMRGLSIHHVSSLVHLTVEQACLFPTTNSLLLTPYSSPFTLHQDCIKSLSGLSPNVPPKTSHNEHIEAFPLPIGIAKLKVSIAKIIITIINFIITIAKIIISIINFIISIIKIIIGDSNFFHHDGKNYHPDSNFFYHDRKNYHRNLYLKGRHNYISCQDIPDKCRDVRVQGFNTWPRYGDV